MKAKRRDFKIRKKLRFVTELNVNMQGSLTVEAALIFPLVIFVCTALVYVMLIIGFEKELYDAMYDSADLVSKYAYAYEALADDDSQNDLEKKAQVGAILSNVYADMIDKADSKIVKGGIAGISLLNSCIDEDSGEIKLVADYTVKIPFPFKNLFVYRQCTILGSRLFVGLPYVDEENADDLDDAENEETEDKYVYITANGKVYHTDSNCSYIRVKISQISADEITSKRNKSGGKYYPCEKCAKNKTIGESVYITNYGDRYHISLSCSEIKRSVKKVKLSSVEGMRECAKCSAK